MGTNIIPFPASDGSPAPDMIPGRRPTGVQIPAAELPPIIGLPEDEEEIVISKRSAKQVAEHLTGGTAKLREKHGYCYIAVMLASGKGIEGRGRTWFRALVPIKEYADSNPRKEA